MGADAPAPAPQESTAKMLDAYVKSFPDLLNITNQGAVPAAQAQLAANQATAPGLAALQAELYKAYGPSLGATADTIAANSAKSQAGSDLAVLQGPGSQLVKTADQLQREQDPEYYAARTATGNRLSDLYNSIDLSGRLSGGETEAINRSLARDNTNRGIPLNTPDQTSTVANAMTFGQAGYNRKLQAQDTLGKALSVGTGFLPASKSNVDVLQVGTGRASAPNAGDSKFTGVDTSLGSSAQGLGNNLLGQIGSITTQANDINSKRRDQLDRFNNTFSSIVGSG